MSLHYTDDHEYVLMDGDTGTVGISAFAQAQLGDVVYVELPKVGDTLQKGAQAGVVESVKSASEVYAPVSGEVVAVNEALVANPALVNEDPTGAGWFFKLRLSDAVELDALKDEAAYKAMTEG